MKDERTATGVDALTYACEISHERRLPTARPARIGTRRDHPQITIRTFAVPITVVGHHRRPQRYRKAATGTVGTDTGGVDEPDAAPSMAIGKVLGGGRPDSVAMIVLEGQRPLVTPPMRFTTR